MKVLHVISGDLWAGAEVQAFTLLKHLKECCDLKVVILNSGELYERCIALGVEVELVDESKYTSLGIVFRLRKAIKAFGPDIVHTHRQKENVLSFLAAIPRIKTVSIRTCHGATENVPVGIKKVYSILDDLVGRYYQKAIIAVSDDLKRKLESKFPASRIHVIKNGVDTFEIKRSNPRNDLFAQHKVNIGIVGRLESVKRVDIYLDMADILLKSEAFKHAHFHIIGSGSLMGSLEEHAIRKKLQRYVTFHGHRSDIVDCLSSLDLLVMCSDHEGTPMTALESLAVGTPVLAHNVGGLTELLQFSPECMVDDHSPAGYANTVLSLQCAQSKLSPELPENYNAHYNASEVLKLYTNLLIR